MPLTFGVLFNLLTNFKGDLRTIFAKYDFKILFNELHELHHLLKFNTDKIFDKEFHLRINDFFCHVMVFKKFE